MKAYRGVDKFYVAEVLEDNETEIKYGVPYNVSAVQHVTREDPEESAKVYADNKAVIVVKGEGRSGRKTYCFIFASSGFCGFCISKRNRMADSI